MIPAYYAITSIVPSYKGITIMQTLVKNTCTSVNQINNTFAGTNFVPRAAVATVGTSVSKSEWIHLTRSLNASTICSNTGPHC